MLSSRSKLLIVLPLLLPACKYFELVEPEPPETGQQEVFPDTPDKVLENMENALDTYYNSLTYSNCLAHDFTFYPDEGLPYPSNQPWGKDTEDEIIANLLLNLDYGTSQPSDVSFTVLNRVDLPDSAYLRVLYRMSYVFRNVGNVVAEGEAEVFMRKRMDGRWVVVTWRDRADTAMTWGEVKLMFK